GQYILVSGNQLGAILLRYLLVMKQEKDDLPANPYVVTTTVTSDLGAAICKKCDIQLDLVHTGFKYIGDRIHWYEKNNPEKTFLFGYEESYGYLISDNVRDKDALQAGYIAVEAACYYKEKYNKDLLDVLNDIYDEFGYYYDKLFNLTMPGKDGQEKIRSIMQTLRANPPKELGGTVILEIEDYNNGINGLEPANVIKLKLTDGSFIALRPSGTEPKFKIYCCVRAENKEEAEKKLEKIYYEVESKYFN
ncbi:MAG: phospho-sugar mutase, partial [Tissierellia bacterium]|nr:phospho-sugar mutase [Tissierellia bacterium]